MRSATQRQWCTHWPPSNHSIRAPQAGCLSWFWPTIAAALVTKHHWLVIICDACGTVIDLDLTMKQNWTRKQPIRIVLDVLAGPVVLTGDHAFLASL
jgi:hypothetical protein